MLGPLARSRALVGAAALTTLAAAGVAFASGTSATAGRTPVAGAPETRTAAPFLGPVAAVPAPAPLVRTDGPLLTGLVATRRAPLTSVHRPMGPFAPSTSDAPADPPGDLGPGSPVPQVRAVQRLLNARGAGLRVDGAWGPATTAAVRRLQQQLGLPVDGRLGPATLEALRD